MRRRLLIAAVFLLGGAVVNVAVAWGCAFTVGSDADADRARALPKPGHQATVSDLDGLRSRGWEPLPSNECYRWDVLVDERRNRHGDRVWYEVEDGSVRSVPLGWTSLRVPEPFETFAAGRAPFRPADLLALAALVDALAPGDAPEGPEDV